MAKAYTVIKPDETMGFFGGLLRRFVGMPRSKPSTDGPLAWNISEDATFANVCVHIKKICIT